MKTTDKLLAAITGLLLLIAALNAAPLFQPGPEPAGIAGAYELVFYSEDGSEAETATAARYNQQERRAVLNADGTYYLFLGSQVKTGQWAMDGETLTLGKDTYTVHTFPGGMAWKGGSYMVIAAWRIK